MKARFLAATSCALLLTVGGCGDNADEAAPATSSEATTTAESSTAESTNATTGSTTAEGGAGGNSDESTSASPPSPPADCTVSQLTTRIDGEAEAAAGSTSFQLAFTNAGGSTCNLTGFPGVSYTSSEYSYPIGAPAERTGEPLGTIQLMPGETATSTVTAVDVRNYPEQECGPVPVPGIHVYPPNSYEAVYLDYPSTACSIASANQLTVTAVSVPEN